MVRFTDFSNGVDERFSTESEIHGFSTFWNDVFDIGPDECILEMEHLKYDESFDKDFLLYLKDKLVSSGDDVEGEKDDEGEDPHLKMFMNALRVDGNSYCAKGNGDSEIEFEVLTVSDDERGSLDETNWIEDVEDREGEKHYDGKNVRSVDGRDTRNLLKRRLKLDHKQNSRELRNVMENRKAGCSVKNVKNRNNVEQEEGFVETERGCLTGEVNFRSEGLRNVPRKRKRCQNENISHVSEPQLNCDKEDDPCYMSFIRNCEKNIDSSKRDRRNSSKRRLRLDHNRNSRKPRNVTENGKVEGRVKTVKNRDNVVREENFIETERDCFIREVNFRSEHLGKVSHKTKGFQDEDVNHVSEPKLNCDKEDDPCYKSFLGNCEKKGDSFALVANGKRVVYEEDDNQSSSDSEIMVLDKAPDCAEWNYTPVSKSKERDAQMEEDDLQCLGSRSKPENPLFRKEVMDILRKPFSHKEYKRLLEDVELRKPTERHIDLRHVNKTISKTEIGKSYLDHYADLESQLDAFKSDNPKRLNILRGFFFYLKKMSEDGIFKPWLDKSCLAIIPRTG